MSAVTVPAPRASGVRMSGVMRMEWLKLRSVRSTWLIVAVSAVATVAFAVLLGIHTHWSGMSASDRASFDPVNNSFAGLGLSQLLFGALGVLVISTEFSSGLIRATFAAVPARPAVLAAKAAMLGGLALVTGEIIAFAAYAAGELTLRSPAPHATLGQPGVLRAVLMAGAYPALIALIGLGLGALIRHTAGAICAVVGIVFVLPLLILPMGTSIQNSVEKFLPEQMAENSLTAVKPVAHSLAPGVAFGLLCLYAVVALAAGALAVARRDA
jgi:ABC-2 type transport system permease protein